MQPWVSCLNAEAQDGSQRIDSYLEALHEYRLFSGSVLVALEREVVYEGGFAHANMAWDDTLQIVEHGGSIFGFATGFWRVPDERMTVILLDNSSSGSVREIGHGLLSILHGHTAPRLHGEQSEAADFARPF